MTDGLSEFFNAYRERTFLVVPDGSHTTYGEFLDRACQLATSLNEAGFETGDRILLSAERDPNVLLLYLAGAMLGLTICPIDPNLPASRLEGAKAVLGPHRLLANDDLRALIDGSRNKVAWKGLPPPGDEPYQIIFSSGTTDAAKGIAHSLNNLIESAKSFAKLSELSGESVVYHHFPVFYMAGIFNLFLCPVVVGARIVFGTAFSGTQMVRFWEVPKRAKVNHLTLTPTMALALVQLYRQDDELLAQLQTYQAVISTSALLHKSIARRFNDVFQVPLRSCYGVTEVGGSITLQTWDEALEGESVGQHRPEIRIHCDGTTAKPAEVFCRTPFMMLGYLVDGKITSYANAEGFFPTGDLGYLDEGALHIVGRANDLVKRSGEFVSLQLIENLALRNGNIQEAAVVAVPDEFWGSKIILFYVPVTGANIEGIAADLDASFRSELRSIEFPTKVIPVLELPKTSIGKTIKRELINRYTI